MPNAIARASVIWGASIALSKVIGLFREGVLGRTLGAGAEADAYWAAFVVPDFLNYLLAGGALSIVFIPIFAGHLARGGEAKAWEAFSAIAGFLAVLLGVLTIFLWVGMPQLVGLVAPGFDEGQQARIVELTRIVLPAQVFHVLGGLLAAALQARERHLHAALAPILYNAAVIAGGLVGGSAAGATGFAWGVLVGSAIGPFLLPWIGCQGIGMRWSFGLDPTHPELRAYLARSLPIMLGLSIVVVDDWLLRREGSRVGPGAVSTLAYAKNLMKVPMGVFGLAAGVAAYPTLARLVAEGRESAMFTTLIAATRKLLVLALAATIVLLVAAPQVVVLVYGRERLDPAAVRQVVYALVYVSLGLWAWSAQSLLARGFYALGNTWMPALLGTGVALLAWPLYVVGRSSLGTAGLALTSALAITVYTLLLAWKLVQRMDAAARAELAHAKPFVARTAVATGLGWALGTVFGLLLPDPQSSSTALMQLLLLASVALSAFAIAAHRLGVHEVLDLARATPQRRFLPAPGPGQAPLL